VSSTQDYPLPPWFQEGGILRGSSAAASARLESALELLRFEPGELIYACGAPATDLLFIAEGEARVFRPDGPDAVEIELARVGAGRTLGETTFVTRGARTASVEAVTGVVAWRLSFEALDEVIGGEPGANVVYRHIAEQLAESARRGSDDLVAAAVEVSLAAKLLVTVIAIQSGTLLATGVMTQLMSQVASSTIMLVGYLLFITAIGVFYVRGIKLPLRDLGVTLEGWRASLRDAAGATAAVMALLVLFKWALVTAIPAYHGVPIFDVLDVTGDHGRTHSEQLAVVGWSAAAYTLAGGFQELYARGMLQGQLYRFFRPRIENPWPSILVSNLLFGSIHISWSLSLTAASFFGGLLWGWLYARQQTLLGPTVSHIILGLWAGNILRIFALF
jgi:CRP/FNR family cyclic AMP-dependent transcriptional regulator